MTLFVETLLSLLLFYGAGVVVGWLVWGRSA